MSQTSERREKANAEAFKRLCESEPVLDVPCESKNAHVAYMLAADRDDPEGESHNDGEYFLYLNVTDQNIVAGENANPVMTLRMRYDRWKAGGDRGRMQKPAGH